MSAKVKYTNEPLGRVRVIPDFLPPPDQLVFREDTVKVTLSLSRHSVEFFKEHAEKNDTQYQPMIRRLVDAYVARCEAEAKKVTRKRARAARSRK